MSTFRTIAGSAVPTLQTIALSTTPAQLCAASSGGVNARRFIGLYSAGSYAIVGSSTATSSTEGALIPANSNPTFQAPAITMGKLWGISTAGGTASVGVVLF